MQKWKDQGILEFVAEGEFCSKCRVLNCGGEEGDAQDKGEGLEQFFFGNLIDITLQKSKR